MKKASEIFGEVDPNLRVKDRRTGRKGKRKEWDLAGGAFCSRCGQEAVRFRPEDGVCHQCARDLNLKQDQDDLKMAKQIKFYKKHNARVDKRKRGAN